MRMHKRHLTWHYLRCFAHSKITSRDSQGWLLGPVLGQSSRGLGLLPAFSKYFEMPHFHNCSGFSDSQLTILTALRGGTSAVACVAATVLLIVTCACRSKLGLSHGRRESEDRHLKVGLFALFGVSISYLTMLSLGVVYHLLPDPSAR